MLIMTPSSRDITWEELGFDQYLILTGQLLLENIFFLLFFYLTHRVHNNLLNFFLEFTVLNQQNNPEIDTRKRNPITSSSSI